MKSFHETAFAKVNLFLDMTAKREDGYHNIDGVMQSVSLCDEIKIDFEALKSDAQESNVSMEIEGNEELPTDEKNLAVQAALAFLKETGLTAKVRISLTKRIPMAAGLGGGSSDAAAVLRALNRALQEEFDSAKSAVQALSQSRMISLAAKIGADVPFCLFKGARRTEGIGEILTEIPTIPPCFIVIARGKEEISTPLAYRQLDLKFNQFLQYSPQKKKLEALQKSLEQSNLKSAVSSFFNIFEEVVEADVPEVTSLRNRMEEQGALRAMMSGSGPSVFGVFDSLEKAKAAQKDLCENGVSAFLCTPVSA